LKARWRVSRAMLVVSHDEALQGLKLTHSLAWRAGWAFSGSE
jgi:hypothetical protein